MPDHVRNPHKYTCYVLEEPLTVGGGDATADGAQAEMEKVLWCKRPSSQSTRSTFSHRVVLQACHAHEK